MKKRDCCEIILNHACDLRCAFCSQAGFAAGAAMKPGGAVRHIYAARPAPIHIRTPEPRDHP